MQGGGATQARSEPPLRVCFDFGELPLGYHYTDYSYVLTNTAMTSLPKQHGSLTCRSSDISSSSSTNGSINSSSGTTRGSGVSSSSGSIKRSSVSVSSSSKSNSSNSFGAG